MRNARSPDHPMIDLCATSQIPLSFDRRRLGTVAMPSPLALLALLSVIVMAALIGAAGLRFGVAPAMRVGCLLVSSVAIQGMLNFVDRPYAARLKAAISAMTLFVVFCLTGAIASYAVATLTTGYYDWQLQHIDTFLRFNWIAVYAFTAAHPALQLLGVAAYRLIYVIPAMLLGFWAFTGEQRRSNEFLFDFWCCAVTTLVFFTLMPAAGPLAYLWHGAIPYMPDSELCQPQLITALRIGEAKSIDVGHLCGLVSAPSFHAVAAALYFRYAFKAAPLKWPIIILTTAMFLSTPVEGTHYLVDLLLGVVVAVIVMGIVEYAVRGYRINRPLTLSLQ
jgi:PAP2 superfamily